MTDLLSTVQKEVKSAISSKHNGEKTKALLKHLNKIFQENANNVKLLNDVCNVCMKNGFLDLLRDILGKSTSKVYEKSENNFKLIKEVIWNYSDRCPDLCQGIFYDGEIVSLLITELQQFALNMEKLADNYVRHHVKANFGILHNLLRHFDDIKSQIVKANGPAIVTCYTRSEYLIIQTYAFVILAFCPEANEMNTQPPGTQVFEFLHELLKDTIKSPNHISIKYGLSAKEVVQCISKLANSDANKSSLVRAGYLDTIATMLDRRSFSLEEIDQCLFFLWTMTLNESSKLSLQNKKALVEKIVALNADSSTDSSLKKDSASILYTFKPDKETTEKHIMLSYQWDSQKTVEMLYSYLVGKGYCVWMDIYGMRGSIYCSMAEAVEKADIFVMAITRKYRESENTKKEAEYASVRGVTMLPLMLEEDYKPDGWLGLMLGAKLFVKVKPENPTPDFEKVEKQLLTLRNSQS